MTGHLEQVDNQWRLRFTRQLAHPPEKVWRALTEPEHLTAWFPTTIEGDRAPGAKLRFSFPGGEAPPFDGELVTYEPPELLEFTWGPDLLRFELRAADGGTRLTLLDVFDERGKAARDGAGWHVCLDQLTRHLDGAGGSGDKPGRWDEVHDIYVERFGPEASTIGPPESSG